MTQAVAEDTETSLTEGLESMGVREADKTDKLNQGEGDKATQNDKMDEANETMEETQKEDEDKDAMVEDEQKEGVKGETEMEVREGKEQNGDGDWEIPYSDEEMEDPKSWMPPPQEIKRLYELLAKGDVLELNWVALPRRPPTPPRTPSPERDGEESLEPQEDDNQNRDVEPTEFDFDEEQTPKNAFINRRRTPGSSARSTVRREARMDKVLSDIKRHRRIDEQLLRSGRDLFKSDKSRSAPPPKEPLSPNSQRERERDKDPSTVFSPRQRRY
ncbi:PAXIP1-associated glutamate-rich protein 1 [Alosa sapidissima]|uniref:PAXIP1-associated glutamate-rich protein 1 n=1 Tax=Alosa sapidissima TaxID=34773 RepID=UPI001C07FCC4|nr:PAXIP1-associated glutamate-rich protein 1 [Alosa sapidissima]XP_041943161.1 PAXIP1-associated glutamate-rich protein 1 [Alosa sapidissima]